MSEHYVKIQLTPPRQTPTPEPVVTGIPTSPAMLLLIADLQQLRSEKNGLHVDKLITAAQLNYFDDKLNPQIGIPTIELLLLARAHQLSEIVTNTLAGKYDAL